MKMHAFSCILKMHAFRKTFTHLWVIHSFDFPRMYAKRINKIESLPKVYLLVVRIFTKDYCIQLAKPQLDANRPKSPPLISAFW